MNPATRTGLDRIPSRAGDRRALWIAVVLGLVLPAVPGFSAELVFDFTQTPAGEQPLSFRSTVSGEGPVGDWLVRYEDLEIKGPSAPQSSVASRRALLTQTSEDPTDERFPLLIYEAESYGDFTFTTRARTVSGRVAQMAGIAFRIQDERNYYLLRLSSLGDTVVFYKFVDGVRTPPITAQLPIQTGAWYELTVECRANQIRCLLNGRDLFPVLTDNSFLDGFIGFWTKSDAVSQFMDAHITYTPRETLAQILVREIMEQYPRLVGVRILAPAGAAKELRVVASSDPTTIGNPGRPLDHDVINRSATFFGKDKEIAEVALPLYDRNGDSVAVVRVLLRRGPGQTQAGAVSRAQPIADLIQSRMQSSGDLNR
jgi:hypothetical protein